MDIARRRGRFGRLLLLALVSLAVAAAVVVGASADGDRAQAQGADPRPNVLVVMTDDQTLEQLSGMKRVQRLLVDRGTEFRRNFASFPLCCPSRATYLTGQYAHNHGVRDNEGPDGGYYKLDSSNTLPVWMEDAGYHTGHIGKYLNLYGTREPSEVPPGWTEWYGSVDPSTYEYYGFTLNQNGAPKTFPARERKYQSDVYTRKAVSFIARRAPSDVPFFLSVAYLAPHGGGPKPSGQLCADKGPKPAARHLGKFRDARVPLPPSFNERDVSDKPAFVRKLDRFNGDEVRAIKKKSRCRREALLAVDEGVEKLVDELRSTGELADTLVLFTSDNGFFVGEHRFRGGKSRHYEESTRVPLVMRGPGIPAGERVTDLVANVDLAPTIADAGEATLGHVVDGESLLPLAADPGARPNRDILLESGPGGKVDRPEFAAVRTPRYVWAEYTEGGRELYDLERDKFELKSRHDDPSYADERSELEDRLDELRDCAGASCR